MPKKTFLKSGVEVSFKLPSYLRICRDLSILRKAYETERCKMKLWTPDCGVGCSRGGFRVRVEGYWKQTLMKNSGFTAVVSFGVSCFVDILRDTLRLC